jgi:hypothetical protein
MTMMYAFLQPLRLRNKTGSHCSPRESRAGIRYATTIAPYTVYPKTHSIQAPPHRPNNRMQYHRKNELIVFDLKFSRSIKDMQQDCHSAEHQENVNELSNDGSEKPDQPQDHESDCDNVKNVPLVLFAHKFQADHMQPMVELTGGNLPPQESQV